MRVANKSGTGTGHRANRPCIARGRASNYPHGTHPLEEPRAGAPGPPVPARVIRAPKSDYIRAFSTSRLLLCCCPPGRTSPRPWQRAYTNLAPAQVGRSTTQRRALRRTRRQQEGGAPGLPPVPTGKALSRAVANNFSAFQCSTTPRAMTCGKPHAAWAGADHAACAPCTFPALKSGTECTSQGAGKKSGPRECPNDGGSRIFTPAKNEILTPPFGLLSVHGWHNRGRPPRGRTHDSH